MESLKGCIDFEEFRESCLHRRRYALEHDVQRFLRVLCESARERERWVEIDTSFFRAQIGCLDVPSDHFFEDGTSLVLEQAYPAARLKPLDRSARQGRVNPQGIPALYVATDEATAISEVRPFVGSTVSVAEFRPKQRVRLVDCAKEHAAHGLGLLFREELLGRTPEIVWAKIDKAFMEPASRDESEAEYAPTQILAEHFEAAGFDGVYFKSALGPGFNVALFDPALADPVNAWVVHVQGVDYRYERSQLNAPWKSGE